MNTADILVAALRAADIPTGDAQARDGTTELTGRYVVVWPVQELPSTGPISDPNADRSEEFQITACGPSRLAADQMAALARAVALGPLDPPDGYAWFQAPQFVGGAPTRREISVDPDAPDESGWYRADVYRFPITPAGGDAP